MSIRLEGIDLPIGGGRRLEVESLRIRPDSVTVLFGPNGAGKTTLLRVLAGTLPGGPGQPVAYLPQRPYIFRGPARRSLLLGLAAEQHARALALAEEMGVGGVLDQPGRTLSGGERRKVALSRTLAGRERMVALDEPFADMAAADLPLLRALVAEELEGRTGVVVTHDRTDAAALGDWLVVLVDGAVRQAGPVAQVMALPHDETVAGALGTANLLVGDVAAVGDGLVALDTAEGRIWGVGDADRGATGAALFGAESVTVFRGSGAAPGSARNHWSGRVGGLRYVGRLMEIDVSIGGDHQIVALLTPGSVDALGIVVGAEVTIAVKAASVRIVQR